MRTTKSGAVEVDVFCLEMALPARVVVLAARRSSGHWQLQGVLTPIEQLGCILCHVRPAGYHHGRVTPETVSKLCHDGHLAQAVEALELVVLTHPCSSKSLFCTILKRCAVSKDLVLGSRVHALTVKQGYRSDTFLCNHILRMYASLGRLQHMMHVFEGLAEPDAFTWSAIISAHVKHRRDEQAIQLYQRMRTTSRVKPDGHVFVAALQACSRVSDLKTGQQVHEDVLASGVEPDLFVSSCLVAMYSKCGSLEDAQAVFDALGTKNVVTWTTIIAGYAQQGKGHQALHLYTAMQEGGMMVPDSVTFVCLLQACASVGTPALDKGKHLHAQIRGGGHEGDVSVANSLVNMYAKCGSLLDAQTVFNGLGHKDVVTWTAMIAGYSQHRMGQEALALYSAMQDEGLAVPNSVTFVCLLQACASVGTPALEKGKHLHSQIKAGGHEGDVFVANSLVNMYAKCGSLEDAQVVFDGIGQKTVVTWTAIIAGYSQQGRGQEALREYSYMEEGGVAVPDSVTFVCLLQACAAVGTPALDKGKQLHALIRERGYEADVFIANSLVNMYAKCGSLGDAQTVFDGLGHRDVVTWTALIAGYSQQGLGQEALRLYSAMREEGMAIPDSVTFVCLLQACASVGTPALEKGKDLHMQITEGGHEAVTSVASMVVNMYAKCGSLEDAQRVFDGLGEKDVVAWNAMLAGYSQQRMGQEALRLYSAMQEEGMAVPNSLTFVCLLKACANVAALHVGRQLHAQIVEQGLQADVSVAGSLINMYGKSGSMVDSQQVFDALLERDVVVWNGLVAGYACQGDSEVVFDLVQRMIQDGVRPDSITFISVLTMCSHVGLVQKGWEYFDAMSRQYGISPTEDHYTCMVDLLGRAGQLDEALALVRSNLCHPNASVWHSLLGGCRKWSNVEVGCDAFNEAVRLDRNDAAAYVMMWNIYTSAQMWEQAHEIQVSRKGIKAWKQPGQSWWTDEDGLVHSFLVGDEKHPQAHLHPQIEEKGGMQPNARLDITEHMAASDSKADHRSKNSTTGLWHMPPLAIEKNMSMVAGKQTGRQLHVTCMYEAGKRWLGTLDDSRIMFPTSCLALAHTCPVLTSCSRTARMDFAGLRGMVGRGASHRLAHNQVGRRCSSFARRKPVSPRASSGKGCRHEKMLSRQPTLWWDNTRQSKQSRWSDQQPWDRGRDGVRQLAAVNMGTMLRRSGFDYDRDPPRPAGGYNCGITAETVRKLCDEGHLTQAVEALESLSKTAHRISKSLLHTALKKCVAKKDVALGRRIHAFILKTGYQSDTFLGFHILQMYASLGKLQDAMDVFEAAAKPDTYMWSAIITAHVRHGRDSQAIQLYRRMRRSGVKPDGHVFVAALQACARGADLKSGQQVHAHVLASASATDAAARPDLFVYNSLVDMYAKCGSLKDAQAVFDALGEKSVVTWTAMIAGYAQQGMGQEALRLYSAMQEEGMVVPNSVTFVCLLQACASVGSSALAKGKQLHAQIREGGHEADVFLASSLVNMYAKCGSLEDAQRVFDRAAKRDVVMWTAMIAGYSQQGMGQEALRLYRAMQEEGMAVPNPVTFVCLLQACANVGALDLGGQLHAQMLEQKLLGDVFVAGSLINMYGKCGSMVDAQQVFDAMPSPERNIITWNALIAGYACQGESEVVFDLVHRMRQDGISPNSITFLSVLTVCSHAGLVSEGWQYFEAMSRDYHGVIIPTQSHYTCMVDLLGRAGQLNEALTLVRSMPMAPNAAVWHTLLGACRKWCNVEVGCHAFNEALKLEVADSAAYVLMSNIYTGAQMWEQAQEMQTMRKRMRVWKQPGQSWWTDEDGLVHSFLVGDEP